MFYLIGCYSITAFPFNSNVRRVDKTSSLRLLTVRQSTAVHTQDTGMHTRPPTTLPRPLCVLLMYFQSLFPHKCMLPVPLCYLKMKMKSISSIQKVATLSIVFISTTSCRLSAGMNLTSLMTLSSLKVLSTDRPPSAWPMISHTLHVWSKCVLNRGRDNVSSWKTKCKERCRNG